jgi:hypothetical protein
MTMRGAPYSGSFYGRERDSPAAASSYLLDSLEAFGFSGRVTAEDAASYTVNVLLRIGTLTDQVSFVLAVSRQG